MNHWTKLSIEFANQRNYLDELFRVYPTIPEGIREIDDEKWEAVEKAFKKKNKTKLIESLLSMALFPIKDPYIAFLRRDKTSIERNPATIDRLCGRLFEMGLDEIWDKCTEPKETNRQMGQLFHRWVISGALGADLLNEDEFLATKKNAVLNESDTRLHDFAHENLGYTGEKGLDLVARFNKNYIIGEAKFLTDFGGHQNNQFEEVKNLLLHTSVNARKVAILDGVIYIEGNNKMHQSLIEDLKSYNVMSALVLREFLYQI